MLRGGFCAAANEPYKHFVLTTARSGECCALRAARSPCAQLAARSRCIFSRTLGPRPRTWLCPSVRLWSGIRRRPVRRLAAAGGRVKTEEATLFLLRVASRGAARAGGWQERAERVGSPLPHAPPQLQRCRERCSAMHVGRTRVRSDSQDKKGGTRQKAARPRLAAVAEGRQPWRSACGGVGNRGDLLLAMTCWTGGGGPSCGPGPAASLGTWRILSYLEAGVPNTLARRGIVAAAKRR